LALQGNLASADTVTQTIGTFALTGGTSSAIILADAGAATGTNLTTTGALTTPANGTTLYLNLANAGTGALTLGSTPAAAFTPWAVVTDSTGTGFGAINASSQLVRNTVTTALTIASNDSAIDFTTTPSDPDYIGGTLTLDAGTHATNSLFVTTAASGTNTLDLGGTTLTFTSNALGISGSGNYTIQNGQLGASAALLTLNHVGTGTLTVACPISGATGSFTKAGSGTVVLGGANTYTGTTTVSGGTLQLTSGGSLNTGKALTTRGTGAFDINGISQTLGTVTNNGTITNSSGTAATFTMGDGSVGAGYFTGNLNVVWNQAGTWSTVAGTFSNTGNITLNANGGGQMTIGASPGGPVNNTGTITNSGAGTGTAAIAGVIGPNVTGIIQNSATSTLWVNSLDNSNFSGTVTILAGELKAGGGGNYNGSVGQNTNQLGTGTILLGATSGNADATLGLENNANGAAISNPITVRAGSSGTLLIRYNSSSGGGSSSGPITLANNLAIRGGSGGGMTVSGGVTGTGNIILGGIGLTVSGSPVNNTGTITNSNASASGITISANVGPNVTGVIQNSAASSLTLSGVNSYTGTTSILAGILFANTASALDNSSVILGDTSGVNSAVLSIGNAVTLNANAVTVQAGSAGAVIFGDITANSNSTHNASSNVTLNRNLWIMSNLTGGGGGTNGAFSGNITNAAGSTGNSISLIGASGAGSVTNLTGANTYDGGTFVDGNIWGVTGTQQSLGTGNVTISAGQLRIAAATNLASGKTVLISSHGELAVTANFDPSSLISASSSGGMVGLNVVGFNAALNMSTIGDGTLFLGANLTNASYTAASLTAGSTSPGSGDSTTYRLGGGGSTTSATGLKFTSSVLTGSTSVIVGSKLAGAPFVYGSGWVNLQAANTYTNGTAVNNGSTLEGLAVSGATPFGSTTADITLNGGALQFDGIAGTATTTNIGNLNFNGAAALTISTASPTALTTFTVNGASGLVRSNQGTLQIGVAGTGNTLGGATTSQVQVTNNAPANDANGMSPAYFFDSGYNFLTYGANGFAVAGTVATLTANSNVKLTANTAAANVSVNSLNLGSFSLTGTATVTVLSGGVSLGTGNTTVIPATVTLDFNGKEAVLIGSTTATSLDIVAGLLQNTGGNGLTKTGASGVSLTNTGNSFTGQVTIDQGRLQIAGDGALGDPGNGVLLNGGTLNLPAASATIAATRTITVGGNGGYIINTNNATNTLIIASKITGTGAFLAFNSGGGGANINDTYTLTNATNDFTAPIFIDDVYNGAGNLPTILSIAADNALGDSGNAIFISNGATLRVTDNTTSAGRAINLSNQGGTVDVTGSNKYTVGGVISGDGNLNKISSGAGTGVLELTAANTLSGNTIVTGGSVLLGHANALQFSTVAVSGSGSLTFDTTTAGGTTFTIGGLGGSGNVALADGATAVTLRIGNNNAPTNYSGSLSGTGGALTKIGTGTSILNNTNSYTGATTVSGGTLKVTGSVAQTSGVTVDLVATLDLAGISGSALATTTLVTNNGALNVSTAAQELGVLGGTGSTAVADSASLTADSIMQDTLSIGVGGTVSIRPTTAGFGAGGTSGINQVNEVPEPGTWILLAAGALCLLPLVRRLRRR